MKISSFVIGKTPPILSRQSRRRALTSPWPRILLPPLTLNWTKRVRPKSPDVYRAYWMSFNWHGLSNSETVSNVLASAGCQAKRTALDWNIFLELGGRLGLRSFLRLTRARMSGNRFSRTQLCNKSRCVDPALHTVIIWLKRPEGVWERKLLSDSEKLGILMNGSICTLKSSHTLISFQIPGLSGRWAYFWQTFLCLHTFAGGKGVKIRWRRGRIYGWIKACEECYSYTVGNNISTSDLSFMTIAVCS